ncbi:hypothetical protein ABW19_dt0204802 [Dactylella cylindrospora]|nr:hypothetical protein ABW19_dt0204802 [Dactylella cylindrospora]
MIRAATPLTILLFAAFALLLISVLSVPIIKQITLATYNDVSYGVFGYCIGDQCSPISIGYNPDTALNGKKIDFTLPTNARHSLSSLLIIHPIAAALTLVLMILAACSHLHGPSHNPKYLLATLLFALPTFLTTLLAFLVDILLFIPHLQWGGWLVLAATICILTAGIMTCAMRRTVVSRAAQKARIAVNAEMNGSIYREEQAAQIAASYGNNSSTPVPAVPNREPKLPEFATFDVNRKTSSEGDRVPLNPRNQSPQPKSDLPPFPNPNAPGGFDPMVPRHPTPGGSEFNPSLNRQRSNHTMNSDGFGSAPSFDRNRTPPIPPMMDGRGGYPPRGGPMRGRGGPGMGPRGGGFGPPRGGMGPRGGPGMGPRGGGPFRGRGGPNGFYVGGPNGSLNSMEERPYIGPGPPPVFMPGGPRSDFDRGGFDAPDNMYGPPPRRPTNEMPPFDQGGPYGPPPRRPTNDIPPNDMPYGQPENTRYASPPPPLPQNNNNRYDAYEMDTVPMASDAVVGLAVAQPGPGRTPSPIMQSPTSRYSQEDYVPPRTAWAAAGKDPHPGDNAPVELPVELPTNNSPQIPQSSSPTRRRPSQDYYEDVEPRFDRPANNNNLPSALTAGYAPPTMAIAEYPPDARETQIPPNREPQANTNNNPVYQDPSGSYEELQPGQRSPAMSTSSHFTSISQRGVNPRWPGDTQGAPSGGSSSRRPGRQAQDTILAGNPDFELPGSRGGRGGRRGGFGY